MIYPETLIGIDNKIADTLASKYGGTWYVNLDVEEKSKEVTVTIKAGETEGQVDFIINTDKKVLVTEIQIPSGVTKYSLGKTGSDDLFIKDYADDIAVPFMVGENTSLTLYAEVGTAPSADTDYTFVVKYIELNVVPTS